MIRKSQLFLAIAALAGMNAAMAANCNTTQWGKLLGAGQTAVVGTPVAGDPSSDDGTPNISSRYSGACGLESDAAGDYVQDGSPATEAGYIQRFYVKPGTTSGEAVVFQAMADEATDYPIFQVSYDGANQRFVFRASNATGTGFLGTQVTANAVRNKWYAIETNFNRAAGTLSISNIRGGNGLNIAPSAASITGITLPAGDGVDYAQLGWISGGSGGTVTVDAFESRRSTAIGHLKRADANNSSSCDANDITALANEIIDVLGGAATPRFATGQPDCSEDGAVDANDITCTANVIIGDLGNDTVCGDAP